MIKRTLFELARVAEARLMGDGEIEVTGIASLESAAEGDLVFVEDAKWLPRALESKATAIVAGEFAATPGVAKPMLVAREPKLAFVRAASLLVEPQRAALGIHPSAVIDATARVADGVAIGPHAAIGAKAVIGRDASIGPGVSIGTGARIGEGCVLHANVVLYPGTVLGRRVVVHAGAVLGSDGFGYARDPRTGRYEKFPQVGMLEIGDDVEIGANVTIDRGALDATVIGRGAKLDNLVHVGHNVQIGEDVVIAAQTGISGSTTIGRSAVLAGQCGIADHVRIGEGVILAARAGIATNKVLEGKGQLFWGAPARPMRQAMKEMAVLARLTKEREEG
jgi:UDP-3-O-[3-hydroxymyristoyl] glucosamine N-acyltransferase